MTQSEEILHQYFGYESFRPNQREAVEAIVGGKDTFVLMPTGGGKSMCYTIPSLMLPGVTVVVSPLISLMKDQVDSLRHNGIKAALLNSSLDEVSQQQVMADAKSGQLSMLYVSPERLVQPYFLDYLQQLKINFFAIDEAHCISQWGHDFRPEYRQLSLLRQRFPQTTIVALTATATERVKNDIVEQLHLRTPEVLVASFFRPNLYYRVEPKQDTRTTIRQYIADRPGQSGIVYCQSRNRVEQVAEYLQRQGIKADTYHAGLSDEVRAAHQEAFQADEVQVMVATVAFGMGIDKPDIRYVLHESAPRSLEHYYQETGRAGRDGQSSECILYFSSGDLQLYRQFNQSLPASEQEVANQKLQQVQRFAMSAGCRHHQLLQYFNEPRGELSCTSCDNCTQPRQTFDATELCQKILSCVYRLQRPYSPTYITNVLTGSTDATIKQRRHDELTVYGIIKDYQAPQLRQILLELADRGYITIDIDNYNAVRLTAASAEVLRGQQKVELSDLFLPRKRKVVPVTNGKSTAFQYNQHDVDAGLFEALRQLRKDIAAEEGMPPYIIFADTSLTDMAIQHPTTLAQFANIYGVGQQKLEKYGQRFVQAIAEYREGG